MSKTFNPNPVTKEMALYCISKGVRECENLKGLREETAAHPQSRMMAATDEVALFSVLLQFAGARRVIEVGIFTGYTTLAMAKAVGPEGKIFALDVTDEFAVIGRKWWERAGVADRIDLRVAPALDTLRAMAEDPTMQKSIDFAFVDADKVNYSNYVDALIPLMRVNGVIAIDNVLWHGAVVNPEKNDEDTVAIRAVADKVGADERLETSMVPVADGVLFARVMKH